MSRFTSKASADQPDPELVKASKWFEEHVSLDGRPYTLDLDQVRAAIDHHQNALVTARAGSGKTRVIAAKIVWLVAQEKVKLSQIAAFMFNRTAAAEVNARIAGIKVDGKTLAEILPDNEPGNVASTFHKFALDIVKDSGSAVEIVSERDHAMLVRQAFEQVLTLNRQRLSGNLRTEYLKLTSSFIARAGQKYTSDDGFEKLSNEVESFCAEHAGEPKFYKAVLVHQLAFATYKLYLENLESPKTDFNQLMTRAANLIDTKSPRRVSKLKYLLIDEYQDFSYLFFALVQAIRVASPDVKLFAVGDDWQAINRFAGSDVDYFINFAKYFPEQSTNIPLVTNYRSDIKVVENANDYMLKHYDTGATRAVASSSKAGKIYRMNPDKIRFDSTDITEDGLGDARYQKALVEVLAEYDTKYKSAAGGQSSAILMQKNIIGAAKLLKTVTKIIKHHSTEQIMLLHRHNFTSFQDVTLEVFEKALGKVLANQAIMSEQRFKRQVRLLTMHRSKGLEADIVILLEFNRDQILGRHPYATMFQLFGDTAETERADQHRLIYVALTRAKHRLYILSADKKPVA